MPESRQRLPHPTESHQGRAASHRVPPARETPGRWRPAEPEGRKRRMLPLGHPTKIPPIGGTSSGTASEVTWAETQISPAQRPNLDHWRSPGTTGQTSRIGLITRRSLVQIQPPPPGKMHVRAGPQGPALLLPPPESSRESQNLATRTLVRGSKREIKRGVWELRVSLGKDPVTEKYKVRSKTFHGSARAADEALRDLIDQQAPSRSDGIGTTFPASSSTSGSKSANGSTSPRPPFGLTGRKSRRPSGLGLARFS